ncbi:uncharacterized protein LOC114579918 [Dendrobium catenatum]|uniref:uncharacterized protein LOC114579918 n=1 Tax=Dendrobium catenatum TaxID=906689 RepID=UPI0010A07B92|nr:uncharacterized protein LOC114579918 [Dendrobium catenatum]
MALVQRFGKLDLFITITCNPDWQEIQHELQPGQSAQDRPDLTTRIFRAKLQDLKDQLFKKSVFGGVAAYNCHINVEICSGIKAVKYIYKYIYKGHDKISVSFSQQNAQNNFDEIQHYQDGRWVSAQEALWRIFEFDLNEMYPSVCNLQLHLEEKQPIYYKDNQNLLDILKINIKKKTMLTEFFNLNEIDSEARKYLYREIPEKYVWDKTKKSWKRRQKYEQIGRINTTNPTDGERYYLRILLNHVYGPTSFSDLLHVNGIHCSTFKEAAEKHGLLEMDNYITECLNDASVYQMPYAFRQLFVVILIYCEPTNVRQLWIDYYKDLSQDYQNNSMITDEECMVKTLSDIKLCLERMGSSLDEYDLPKMPIIENDSIESNVDLHNKEVIEEINVVSTIEDINRKTYLYRAILATLRSNGHIAVLATATSGVAASNLPGGRTAHSRFKIPINSTESRMCAIPKQSGLAQLLIKSSIIIWDELPMVKRTAIESLDRTLRDIMNNSKYFGGKIIVFGGDFRQVLPVVRRA